ncbi:DegT/DnrJ/EryC1/StrS family aminotransferase [Diaphorobacter ruginosibacter]|uniref:DegT/DnrJ/EryC1/StrS family aminotransferase n=1 Tax=Diaphorobacter ruginosibacter TaxID=1715720 RepID=A0A7G9RL29_9BURK|nr:DegT/DnrJ/EryC1/StrS family aminotransferase [Diaphorobacter ruginosibacter]QNN56304.1 DegT/DnrJ/EryC1/StrS family aminotransferase [Diaphorobacter ruginosibacter]
MTEPSSSSSSSRLPPTPPALPTLPFALPDIGEAEIAEVVDTLRSGWLTTGPKARRFEQEFAEFLGDAGLQCIAVNSATAGLHLALEAAGIGPGDEVITATHTFTASAEVIRYLGADPVIVDIEQHSWCIDPREVEKHITSRTRAIIPVHFGGRSADMSAILAIAKRHGIKVIEDAAHALPCTHRGAMIGTLASDAAVFSFYANKTMTTGEGGMLVTRDEALARRAKVMRLHGIDRDAFARFNSATPAWRYDIVAPGFKYNMTDIAAAIGLVQLTRAHEMRERRAAIAAQYDDLLADTGIALPPHAEAGDVHAWHLYPVALPAGLHRDRFIDAMFAQGIGMSVHYIPLHQQSYWKESCRLHADDFPVSETLYRSTASLPIYTRMTDGDVRRVAEAVRRAMEPQ